MTKRVVILGAGFAGLAACDSVARGGADLEIVLADRHTYNTFQPLLYQVATAGLNPGDIAYPIRGYLRRHPEVTFRQGVVRDVDFDAKRVAFDEGHLDYDYLVIATGATTNFFGVPGAAENGRAIYTMEDAISVRDSLTRGLERASTFGVSHGELTVVLVGGGPTGVEMAGTLAELRNVELKTTYKNISREQARIVLVEQRDRLLGGFGEREARYALGALESRGVEVRLNTAVESIAADHVVLSTAGRSEPEAVDEVGARDHETLPCGMVIWSAGVSAGELADTLAVPQGPGGRVSVGVDLRLAEHPDVFVIGDVPCPDTGAAPPLPQLAQPAIQEGRHAGRQILALEAGRATTPFVYKDKGIMATIGRRAAVAELANGLALRGTIAWAAWLALHVVTLLGFRNRLAVMLNWAWRYAWWRRATRVIAGT